MLDNERRHGHELATSALKSALVPRFNVVVTESKKSKKGTNVRKHMTYRRLVTGIVTIVMLLSGLVGYSPVAAQDRCTPNAQNEVADGCTLEAGTLALWEGAAYPSSWLYAGYIGDDGFTVNRAGGYNAWAGFDNVEAALDGACRTAEARMTANGGGFTTVYVNDTPYSDRDACLALKAFGNAPSGSDSDQENAPANTDEETSEGDNAQEEDTDPRTAEEGTDGLNTLGLQTDEQSEEGTTQQEETGDCRAALGWTGEDAPSGSSLNGSVYDETPVNGVPEYDTDTNPIRRIPEGSCRDSGLVVLRFVNNSKRTIDVSAVILDEPIEFGKDGELAFDGWEGYGSPTAAVIAACGQAIGDYKTTDDPNSWNFGYTVTFNGDTAAAGLVCE